MFIVNPAAAGGRARRAWATIERTATRTCPQCEVAFSSRAGEATTLAREAVRGGAALVVAVGGDGTVNEVVNGLVDDETPVAGRAALGIIGLGTGRDLARTLDLPSDPNAQLTRLASGAERRIDLGRIVYRGTQEPTVRYFANVASFGLSGETDRIMNRSRCRWLPAKVAFQIAVLRALVTYRNAAVRLRVNDGPWQTVTVKLAALCNGRHFGAGMRIAPAARLDDGLLDGIVIGDVSVSRLVRKLGTVYRGEHLELPEVSSFTGRIVDAEPVHPGLEVPLDVDGEALGSLPATFEVVPGALRVRC